MERSARDPFDWLDNPRRRRGALVAVRMAVRRGWLDGPDLAERRAALVARLAALAEDPTLGPRELLAVFRIITAMGEANQSVNGKIPGLRRISSARVSDSICKPPGGTGGPVHADRTPDPADR